MRQAIVITNPKWELFTKASDAFKGASPPAVLVVRGRCKEKKLPKTSTMNTSKSPTKKAAAAAVCVLFALNLWAGDITSYLPANTIAAATTNTTGGGTPIGWRFNDILALQAAIYSTNNAHADTKSNLFIRFHTSLNGSDKQTNVFEFSIPTATYQTNQNNAITLLTNTDGSKWLYIGDIENANTNRVYIRRFHLEKVN